MITGVVLAAGRASRMGKVKQILPFKDSTILGCTLENARRSMIQELIVVLGHSADEIQEAVDLSGTRVVVNHRYGEGQSSSLKLGLGQVSPESEAVVFLLADQPLVGAEIINKLIEAFFASKADIIVPTFKGKRGNPVLISRNLFPDLQELFGDVGARSLLEKYAHRVREIETGDSGIIQDIDVWEDYLKFKGREI